MTAPRITQDDIESAIVAEFYFTAKEGILSGRPKTEQDQLSIFADIDLVTFCVIVTTNGTKLVGVNTGPVSRENFDPAEGKARARQKALEQLYPLLGYELRGKLGGGGGGVLRGVGE